MGKKIEKLKKVCLVLDKTRASKASDFYVKTVLEK
jgi:hypothetical protein